MIKTVFGLLIGLFFTTSQAIAHGTAEEHQAETGGNLNFFMIGMIVLFVLFLALHFIASSKVNNLTNVKKQADREKRLKLTKWASRYKWLYIASLLGSLILGGISLFGGGASNITLLHIHGLGYSPDGNKLLIPAHDGFRVYEDGRWSVPSGDKNDYMGFTAVDNGFYSSGHPGPGSSMSNPIGIIKSKDDGKTLSKLALEGESDFHVMSVGYKTHTLYVINSAPNSIMTSPGLYYSKDEAKTWTKSVSGGLEGEPVTLAIHPVKENVIALGTQTGAFISRDYGQSFEKIVPDLHVTALYFDNEGKLIVGGYTQEPVLQVVDIETKMMKTIPIPKLRDDAITYLAQNPVMANETVFTTVKRDIYLTHDDGSNWLKIADQGNAISASK
jgi:hypothetical protein